MKERFRMALRRLRIWWSGWDKAGRISDELGVVYRRQRALEKERDRIASLLRDSVDLMDQFSASFERTKEIIQQKVAQATELIEKYERELEGVRDRYDVMKNLTIPALVSSHKVVIERLDAQTAIEVQKQVGALPREQ
jgi:hypothetical protein